MLKKIARHLTHIVADSRKFYYNHVSKHAESAKNKRVLEIGSGPLVNGEYYYSVKHLFDDSNKFEQTDVIEEFGHPMLDITTMQQKNMYDYIICLNVLEHVYEFQKGVQNMHRALKPSGMLIVAVPAMYPLHDEPGDYWRFTEHSLRKIFADFKKVTIKHTGKREFPFGYYLEAQK